MHRLQYCLVVFLVWTGVVGLGGCRGDRGPERVVVSGAITYNGKPIPEGEIRFVPTATSSAPVSIAAIVDGKYRADHLGGVPVGTHKIEVQAFHSAGGKAVALGPAPQNYLPKRFNAESQRQITIDSGSRELTKDFDLTDGALSK
jgi:hypothetical protein